MTTHQDAGFSEEWPGYIVLVDDQGNPFKPSPEPSAAHDAWTDEYVDHMLIAHPWVFGAKHVPMPEERQRCSQCAALAEREPPMFGDE